jgi:cell division transport system ATP-binding protein
MSFSSEPIINASEVSIFQDNNTILAEVNFSVKKGAFVFLVGRTGSGKSSLLRTLYADLPVRLGDLKVAGYDLRKIKSKEIPLLRRKLGIIFQDFQLFQDRTVDENLAFVLRATGWKDKSKMKARQAEVLMKVGLGSVSNKMPHQLSGGEQQRVVIARALLNEPLVLLADEPTGNLDPEVSNGILDLFKQINRSGTSILMATHDFSLLDRSAYKVLKCEQGKLIVDSNQATTH